MLSVMIVSTNPTSERQTPTYVTTSNIKVT